MVAKGISMDDVLENGVGRWSNNYMSEEPMNCSEDSPTHSPWRVVQYFYRNSVVTFREQKGFVLKTLILLTFGLGICEGISEDSGHGIGHIDIRVGSCNYLNVFVLPCMCT